jgi:hypothetical protein
MMLDLMKHNYYKKLKKLFDQGKIPTMSAQLVEIYHDDWCAIYRGKYCNCDPDIKLRNLSPGDAGRS